MSDLRARLAEAHDIDRPDVVREWAAEQGGVLDSFDLQTLADGPIIDPVRIYLPAGRLTPAQLSERERRWMKGEL